MKTWPYALFMITMTFGLYSQSDSSSTRLELGYHQAYVENRNNLGYHPNANVRGFYVKPVIQGQHRLRWRTVTFDGDYASTMYYRYFDKYSGRLLSLGYEYEHQFWSWLTAHAGLEYFSEKGRHRGYWTSDTSPYFQEFDKRYETQGLGLPFGLHLTLFDHIRVGLEMSLRYYTNHRWHEWPWNGRGRIRGCEFTSEGFYIGVRI